MMMDLERKKIVSQVSEINASWASTKTRLVKVNLILSVSIAFALLSLRPSSVPDALRLSSVPDAFVICIIFSFTGSFCWLFMGNSPKLPAFRRCYFVMSTLFMALALSVLASALFLQYVRFGNPENFRLVSRN